MDQKQVITFSSPGEKKVQDTYIMLAVCFYINSLFSTPEVLDNYTHYPPIHHQSFGNVGLCLALFCKLQSIASALQLHVLAEVEAITFCKSMTAFAQWSESLFECQNFL